MTLCGCRRTTQVQAPPPEELVVPLAMDTSVRGPDGKRWMPTRTFKLVRTMSKQGGLVVHYREVAK